MANTNTREQDYKNSAREQDYKNTDVTDIKRTAQEAVAHIPSKAEIKDMAQHAGERVRSFFNEKGEQINEVGDACKKTIRQRPLTSTAAAFAGGLLISALLRRK